MSKHPPDQHPFFAASQRAVQTSMGQVSYRKLGTGPAVLFIHGWPLHGATYRDVAVSLADRYTCFVIDLPGAGASPGYADWSQPLRSHVRTTLEVIDALGLDRLALVAHDSGGAIARWVAAELGERITALILSNTEITGHIVPVVKNYARFIRLPGSMFLMRLLFRSAWFRRSGLGFGGCFGDRSLIDGAFHELFIAPLQADRTLFGQTMRMLANVDFEELADLGPIHGRITAPTRFVWGARDPFFPLEGARRMASELANFDRFIEVPEGKLFVHEEYPQVVADAAAGLLDAVIGEHRRESMTSVR